MLGVNPRSATPFWPHWDDANGMDREGWLAAYLLHHGKYRRSRAAIERFVPLIKGSVFEANAYAKATRRLADLAAAERTIDVLPFLMHAVQPNVVISAGRSAARGFAAVKPTWNLTIFEVDHFIYWGRNHEHELASRVNTILDRTIVT